MTYSIAYYDGTMPLTVTPLSDASSRDGVAYIDVTLPNGRTHRLQGADIYFIDGDVYGMASNEGQVMAYTFADGEHVIADADVAGILFYGAMMTDEHARMAGVL